MANDPPLNQDDAMDQWVQAAASDRKSFGRLFDLFYPQIFAYCSRRLLVRAVAEDVASEVFLKVAKAIANFEGSTSEDFRRWLYRITTNEINAQLRKSIRQQALLEMATTMGLVGKKISSQVLQTDSDIDWELIYRAIGQLSQREQSIVSLRFFGHQSREEIAHVLEIKTGTVRVALSRALDKLRTKLQEPHQEPTQNKFNINSALLAGKEKTQ